MLYSLAPFLSSFFGPFRLFGSYLVLIGIGTAVAALSTCLLLPAMWGKLPKDQGRPFAASGEKSKGKPTGGGALLVPIILPVLVLVMPWNLRLWEIAGCLCAAMTTGYLDDAGSEPWGEFRKGSLDLAVALATSLAFCQGRPVDVWLPVVSGKFSIHPGLFIPLAGILLWFTINATNCSDGVDGLAGSLTLLSLLFLGGFLYVVIGHSNISEYLLIPHNPDGAIWAVMLFTVSGALGGYLWHNASPSRILMGDAGSRFLGLLLGVAVLATGNPFLVLVVAPVILVNGGSGLVKIVLLRFFKKLGINTDTPAQNRKNLTQTDSALPEKNGPVVVRMLHRVRFPLHDFCRLELQWSDAQVLMRFMLIQLLITPLLFGILVKIR